MKPHEFSSAAYGPAVQALLEPARLPELGPGRPNTPAKAALEAVRLPPVCLAGLWLYHDFLDESHAISQEDESDPDRNFWHAIMHRREPDAANSKYWWRRVGSHPVLGQLREHAPALGHSFTTPEAFVDFCERVRGSGGTDEMLARQVQLLEWRLLFDWCFTRGVGG
jgi:hypothetical protein